MLLAPSEIHFLHNSASHGLRLAPDVLDDVSHRLQENRETVPRIQVVEKDGTWFALNNSYLHVYRELERQGKCPKIRVDVVALSKVPQDVQKGMLVTETTMVEERAKTDGDGEQTRRRETDGNRSGRGGGSTANYHKMAGDSTAQRRPEEQVSDYSSSDCESDCEGSESEFDESLSCNVCERSFTTPRQLSQHQQRKRHFGCSICDSIFPTLMALEHHKESLDHWSEDEITPTDRNGGADDETDEESDDSDDDDEEPGPRPEELERLL
ncbi:uncharacterized protein LOC135392096 [Ornithodoros turicata]|uniref:uncharacterized protein LOC135392096 n=1 Tax=Ornithodoros turicata TaxID=34597 RepID=UPI0031394526